MNKQGFWYRVFDLYYDGFRNMRLGKTLWTIILIKLFIMFVILKFSSSPISSRPTPTKAVSPTMSPTSSSNGHNKLSSHL